MGNFEQEAWHELLEVADLPRTKMFLASEVADDATVMRILGAIPNELGISIPVAIKAFVKFWYINLLPDGSHTTIVVLKLLRPL